MLSVGFNGNRRNGILLIRSAPLHDMDALRGTDAPLRDMDVLLHGMSVLHGVRAFHGMGVLHGTDAPLRGMGTLLCGKGAPLCDMLL